VGDENGAVLSFTNRSDHRAGAQSPLGGNGDFLAPAAGDVSPLVAAAKKPLASDSPSPEAEAEAAAAATTTAAAVSSR
jgi:hypothetical protein